MKKTATKATTFNTTEPEDYTNRQILSVLLLKQSTLNDIFDICLPKADDSEFQVHYRSISYKCTKGNATVLINIPTAFYNFKQEVTSTSVDYHLDDLWKESHKLSDYSHEDISGSNYKQIHTILTHIFDKVELFEIADNSFHRHPSPFGFSSTDYDKDTKEPGVIYRKSKCTDIPQTDSVLYWKEQGSKAQVVVTETRIVTVKPHKDGGIEGRYVEVPTQTFILNDQATNDQLHLELAGSKVEEGIIKVDSDLVNDNYLLIDSLVETLLPLTNPTTQFIDPNHITQAKRYAYNKSSSIVSTMYDDDYYAESYGYNINTKEERVEWEEFRDEFLMEGHLYE